jgi:hypothetical protein
MGEFSSLLFSTQGEICLCTHDTFARDDQRLSLGDLVDGKNDTFSYTQNTVNSLRNKRKKSIS